MTRPTFIGNVRDNVRETCRITSTGESLGEIVKLTQSFRRFVVHHEQLPPGRRASSPHSHSHKEEFVFVLSGAPQVWIDGERHALAPGDHVAFAASTGLAHHLTNDQSEVTAEYLVVASIEEDDVVTYRK